VAFGTVATYPFTVTRSSGNVTQPSESASPEERSSGVLIAEPALITRPSPTVEDWERERCPRFAWQPGKRLLRSVRAYQACRARRGLWSKLLARFYVVEHRFWSVVSSAEVPLNTSGLSGGLVLPHPTGVVLHPESVVGPNCALFQQVTLGIGPRAGAPRLGGAVEVGPGAKILGGVSVGDGALIGANAVVVDDVPAFNVATGNPAVCRPQSARRRLSAPP
jgi:serine O-acetyltransferase